MQTLTIKPWLLALILGAASLSATAATSSFYTECNFEDSSLATPCAVVDDKGRQIILRGVNARVQGVFDVNFSDGRKPLQFIPPFGKEDTKAMRELGFYFLRLPIQWSGIEPEMGQYDKKYIERIGKILDLCHEAGIKVMLDMHQDAYSKEIGEDGAPLWAIVPPPEKRNEGGKFMEDLFFMRLSKQTQNAFASFWKNTPVNGKGLQDSFIDAMIQVVERYKDHPALVGMEIFNEPWLDHINSLLADMGEQQIPGLSPQLLMDFYTKAMPRMANAAPKKLIFFEPDVAKNFPHAFSEAQNEVNKPYGAFIPSPIPWKTAQTVYAPHFYIESFFLPGDQVDGFPKLRVDDPDITLNMANSVAEAKAYQAPLMIGEFGFTHKTAQYGAIMDKLMGLMDQHAAHSAQWVWKEASQDSWGFYDFKNGKPVLREKTARATARAYPQAISGRILRTQFDPATYALNVSFKYRDTQAPHTLFVPVKFGYKKGYTVTCDGQPVKPLSADAYGQIQVACGKENGKTYTLGVVAN
jgi:endoglycosylceramidase